MSGDVHLTVGLVAQALGVAAIVSSPLLVCMLASFRLHRIRHEHAEMMGRQIRTMASRPHPVKKLRKLISELRAFLLWIRSGRA